MRIVHTTYQLSMCLCVACAREILCNKNLQVLEMIIHQ